MTEQIRSILRDFAKLSVPADALTQDTNLYRAGMTSHASVSVMLALEGHFDIEFPDRMLRRSVFESIRGISQAIEELTRGSSIRLA
jgi:acyl carrier protein